MQSFSLRSLHLLCCLTRASGVSRVPLLRLTPWLRHSAPLCSETAETAKKESTRRAPVVPGTVYFVATPIGNLEDITLRAIRTLREVDVIASEDTRVTSALLRALEIPPKKLVSHHDNNLAASVPRLSSLLASGLSVAVVSDAGTPGISDPGLALATECAARGVPIVPVPGPCAAVAAISVAGVSATEFVFAGFVARGGKSRRSKVAEISAEPRAVVRTLARRPWRPGASLPLPHPCT